jgi:N-methylhydantoinase A
MNVESTSTPAPIRIGIDIGGTFTDFVIFHADTGKIDTFKLLSTPQNPAEAVLAGLQSFLETQAKEVIEVIHGSTVATNALLERKGARTALITTRGFRDVLQIARQNRPDLYDFSVDPPEPIIPAELRFEVDERVDAQGKILIPLAAHSLVEMTGALSGKQVESVAICLLFSFLYPEHEKAIARQLREAGFFVSPSCEILPEFREYERTSTTAVNAYVSPVLDRYLGTLQQALSGSGRTRSAPSRDIPADETNKTMLRMQVMQSNGGSIGLDEARRNGVRCILSGPAGGIIGANYVGKIATDSFGEGSSPEEKRIRLITLDMGGTSTDVSLIDGVPQVTTESVVGGCPIRIPVLDIHTIGAGGGSLAYVDLGGALRVGPQSAGADPGPACYGKGLQPTVTDANLVLGRLDPEYFLGGQMRLDRERARQSLAALGQKLGLNVSQVALGVIEIANVHMEQALRLISVERGHDPRQFTLLSFGGAGGLHATDLARRLGVRRLLMPPMASTLSAFGMLASNVVKDYTRTVMLSGDISLTRISAGLARMAGQGLQEVLAEGVPEPAISIERFLDLRYRGQSYELTIPWSGEEEDFSRRFHEHHQRLYGYARPEAELEIVNLRVRVTGKVQPPPLLSFQGCDPDPRAALLGQREVVFTSGTKNTSFYLWERLAPGNTITGPAILLRPDTTVLIGAGDRAKVDAFMNVWVDIGADQDSL